MVTGGNLMHVIMQKHQAKHEELLAKHGPGYDKSVDSFGLNRAEQTVVNEWYETLLPEIKAAQTTPDPLGQDVPYYGAMGGGLTYSFTPTGLGKIIVVKEHITGKELNVSDALDWFFFG